MFRQVRLADFEQQPKRHQVETVKQVAQTVFPNGNVVATEPIRALVLPPRPKILTDPALDAADSSTGAKCDLDPHTGWAMVSAPDGVRLWPVRGTNTSVTPIVFRGDNLIPVFVKPEHGSNQPEIVLLNALNGEILHFRRISFALTEKPCSGRVPLASNEHITKAIACGSSVICASSTGNMYLVQLRDGFGTVCTPTVHRMTQSWFGWNKSQVIDLSSFGSHVACLRQSGQIQVFSIGNNTFTHILDCDAHNLKLNGQCTSLALDTNDTIYVVVKDSNGYRLARIVSGILEQQHSLPQIESANATVYLCGSTKYVLFDHQLVVLEWKSETLEVTSEMDVKSLVKTAKSLNLEAPSHGSLFFKQGVRIFGCKGYDDGCMLLTSFGVLEVDSEIKQSTSIQSLFEQAVFYYYWSEQSPLTFVPAVKQAVANVGNVTANKVAINLCEKIAKSVDISPLPNINDHLDSRINWIRVLINFCLESIDLNNDAKVVFQNNFEQLVTCRSLSDLASSVSKQPRDWLLYNTHNVVDLLRKAPVGRVVNALYAAIEQATPRLVELGVKGYWLTSTDILNVLQNGERTPEYAKLVCTILSYAGADGSLSTKVVQQRQNLLLKELAGRGNVQEAAEIASSLNLLNPLATLMTDRWLSGNIDLHQLSQMIQQHGYEFAAVVFSHLVSIDEKSLVTSTLRVEFPEFVFRFFDSEPNIQWALADVDGNRELACKSLVKACTQEENGRRRSLLASLLRIEAAIALDFESGNEAAKILAQEAARSQLSAALAGTVSKNIKDIVKGIDDPVLCLALLPADARNFICAINLLPWGADDAHKRVLAQQIILKTDWKHISESSLIYEVLWSPSIDKTGVELIEPFLLGDWQVSTQDVNALVPTSLRVKLAAEVAQRNVKALELDPEIKEWVRGACKKVIGNTIANS